MAIADATCTLTLSEKHFAAMLSKCPAFQVFAGVAPEVTDPAARAAAALARIYFKAAPPPVDRSVGYTKAEYLALRPCAIIGVSPMEGFQLNLESGVNEFAAGGKIDMQFDWTIPDDLGEDLAAMERVIGNHIGGVLDDLTNQSGLPGNLALRTIHFAEGPTRLLPQVEAQRGRMMTVWGYATWKTGGANG